MATATSRNIFYYVDDVMDLLGVSRSKAYKIIQDLNAELKDAPQGAGVAI